MRKVDPAYRSNGRARQGLARGFTLAPLGAVLLAVLVAGPTTEARAHEADDVRCETRLSPRVIFGRNYVLDRVTECRRVAVAAAAEMDTPPGVAPRPAPPTGWAGTIDASLQSARWSGDRRVLRNAQYDRSVRAISGIERRAVR